MKITYKKTPKYEKADETKRDLSSAKINKLTPEDLICCDETGIDDNISVLRGWSAIGERSYGEKPAFKKRRFSLIAAYDYFSKDLIAPLEIEGHTNATIFTSWLEECLCPRLKTGPVVIIDNASFHHKSSIEQLINNVGFELIFLPPYCPDLSPIEHCWANFKNKLRKLRRKCKTIQEAITQALKEAFLR